MDANDYQRLAMRTRPHFVYGGDQLEHAALGMCSEAGEFAGLLQKSYQGHAWDREHAEKELGDVLWFVAEACDAMGTSLDVVMAKNVEKLRKRFPDGFEAARSVTRAEGDL